MGKKIAIGICGSFCNHQISLDIIQEFVDHDYDVTIFLSEKVDKMSTKFGSNDDLKDLLYRITGKLPLISIQEAELLVNQKKFDHMLILPCSATTLGKLVNGIYDNGVLMCAKSLLRNNHPICLAIATNDALGISGINIMKAINQKNIFIVPMRQDNYVKKPNSMVFEKDKVFLAVEKAYEFQQLQPIFLEGVGE